MTIIDFPHAKAQFNELIHRLHLPQLFYIWEYISCLAVIQGTHSSDHAIKKSINRDK